MAATVQHARVACRTPAAISRQSLYRKRAALRCTSCTHTHTRAVFPTLPREWSFRHRRHARHIECPQVRHRQLAGSGVPFGSVAHTCTHAHFRSAHFGMQVCVLAPHGCLLNLVAVQGDYVWSGAGLPSKSCGIRGDLKANKPHVGCPVNGRGSFGSLSQRKPLLTRGPVPASLSSGAIKYQHRYNER